MKKKPGSVQRILFVFFCLHVTVGSVFAARISGHISDINGDSLPFVSIVIRGTSHGTTSNVNGDYSFELPAGEHELVFSMIGFHQHVEKVLVQDLELHRDVVLEPESYQLKEIKVTTEEEDPAYAIIRKAQKKRFFYLNQVNSYTCESYVKSTQRLKSYPKRFMGQKVDIDEEIDTTTGIFYLSESVSKIAYLRPDHIREKMISSKVSGKPKAYSFNRGADLLVFSLYQPLISFDGLVPRGIISPIAPNSMLSYQFKLEGAFMENGELINKISVIPRRKNDPVFSGTIFIVEDSWRIHSADLLLTKDQQLQFLDSMQLRLTQVKVTDKIRMPFNHQLHFHFNLFGFEGSGDIVGVFSGYNTDTVLTPRDFNSEILNVEKSSNEKDSSYWNTTRPVPLTELEARDYVRSDSVRMVHESRPYLDSMDRKSNRFKPMNILGGYSHQNSFLRNYWRIESPLSHFQFNTVQGWNAEIACEFIHGEDGMEGRKWTAKSSLQYGFSDERFHPQAEFTYRYDPIRQAKVGCIFGSQVTQFNNRTPITPFINTIYSLSAARNYMKVYRQEFVRIEHVSEIADGLRLEAKAGYSMRYQEDNTTDFTWSKRAGEYTINAPVRSTGDTVHFTNGSSLKLELRARYALGQRYVTYPDARYPQGSKWPVITLDYKKAFHTGETSAAFDFLQGHVQDDIELGLVGSFTYRVGAGGFINSRNIPFMDFRHFNGNQTVVSGFALDDFMGLDYYTHSTTQPFFEAHAEQHFKGFLFNKIPLIRKLGLDEVASAHFLNIKEERGVLELGAGVEKLNVFRFQVFSYYAAGKLGNPGIIVGIRNLF